MRVAATISRGPVRGALRRPPGRPSSHKRWTRCRGPVRLTKVTDPLGHTTSKTYDPDGDVLTSVDGVGDTTTNTFDARDWRTGVKDPRGNITALTYDNEGHLLTSTTPTSGITSYSYDDDGRQSTTVDPRGNVNGGTPSAYTTTDGYDPAGELLTVTDPLGDVTTRGYDPGGRMSSITDADHHVTTYGYDLDDRPTTVLAPDGIASGKKTTSVYDGLGDVTSRTDPNGHATAYTFDPNQRPTGYTTATGQKWTQAYDVDGNPTVLVTGKGNVAGNTAAQIAAGTVTTSYDTLDRPTTTSYGDGTPTVGYAYDTAGRVTSMTDGAGSQSRGYDNADRLTSLVRTPTSGASETYGYTYDADGDVVSRTLPDTTKITYAYDSNDRPSTLTADGASTSYGYDPADELTSATLPAATGTTTAWAYDAAGRLTGVDNERTVSGTKTPTSKYARSLDAAGNPLTLTTTRGTTSRTDAYTYDPDNRLTAVCYTTSSCSKTGSGSVSWAYDLVGNRTSELRSGDTQPAGATGPVTATSSYDSSDQLTQTVKTGGATGSTAYGYDANGNQTTAGTRTSVYDLAGQLTSATVGGTTTGYTYDGWNDRRTAVTGGTTTTYSWDPNNTVDQLATDTTVTGGTTTARSYRYTATGAPASYTSTGTTGPLYDLTDDQRNVSDTLNNAGAAQWAYTYEPFGVTRAATKVSSTAAVNLLGYTGAYTDPATGLLDLRARQYDPTTATFGGRDPVGQAPGTAAFDTFEYAADGPLTGWDPTGRNVWNDITGAASGVGAALEGAAQGGYELATNPVGVVQGLVSACRQGGDGNTVDDAAQCVDNLNPVARIRDTLHQSWDEFEAGCTNLGESSLFNGLTQSALLIAPGADEVGSLGDVADAVQARAAAVRAEMRANPEAGSIQLPGRAGAAEAGGLSAADQSALDYATTSSKLDHIFAAKHNFDPLVEQFGSQEAVVQQLLSGLKGLTPEAGTFEQQIGVGGQKVVVRGAVVDGVTKIGTAFTP